MRIIREIERLEKRASEKSYLNIPFSKKDKAKQLGARWDPNVKKWYFEGKEVPEELKKLEGTQSHSKEKTYLDIPYRFRQQARDLGARWDAAEKKWYWVGDPDDLPKELSDLEFAITRIPFGEDKFDPNQDAHPMSYREKQVGKKLYLDVPFNKKDEAKKHGARWDSTVKKWYWDGNESNLPKELKGFYYKHIKEKQDAEREALEERMSQEHLMTGGNW